MNNHSNKYSKDLQHSFCINHSQSDLTVVIAQTKIRLLLDQVHEVTTIVGNYHIYTVNATLYVFASQIAHKVRTVVYLLIVIEIFAGLEVLTFD